MDAYDVNCARVRQLWGLPPQALYVNLAVISRYQALSLLPAWRRLVTRPWL